MRRSAGFLLTLAACVAVLATQGCGHAPGYPRAENEVARPENVLDFDTLYKANCSGCHGENGSNGAALALNNPTFLAIAGADHLRAATAKGVTGTLMPPFARSAGGMLSDQQIDVLVSGMLHSWGRPATFNGVSLPPYADESQGNAANGQTAFVSACARCHGNDGMGAKAAADGGPAQNGSLPYPIVDKSYLALVNDQSLRSIILGGRPDEGMPDWRNYITGNSARPLSSQEVSDIVAWLASHRTALPVAPTTQHP